MVREQPAIDGQSVATVTNKVPYVLQLEPSQLQLPTMHSSSSPAFILVPRLGGPALHLLRLSTQGCSKYLVHVHKQTYVHTHRNNYFKCVTRTGPPDLKTSLSLMPMYVAKSACDKYKYHIIMPAISPARAANVATHASTKFYTEPCAKFLAFMSSLYAWTST